MYDNLDGRNRGYSLSSDRTARSLDNDDEIFNSR